MKALLSMEPGGPGTLRLPVGIPRLPLNLPLLKACEVRGVHWGAFVAHEPDRHADHVAQLLPWWQEGRIRPRIDNIYPLARGGEAIARLMERAVIGKVVVTLDGDGPDSGMKCTEL